MTAFEARVAILAVLGGEQTPAAIALVSRLLFFAEIEAGGAIAYRDLHGHVIAAMLRDLA